MLDIVEGHFHHDERVDGANVAAIFDRVGQEKFG
jgi:hypothetical protein